MALVPYVGNALPLLAKLHNSSAQFNFANRSLNLAQDWKRLGVAAVVWEAAVVMCMYLEQVNVQGRVAIELGAGTGLVGIVAALLGAKITITDRKPALELLAANVKANVPPDLHELVEVSELSWGEHLDRYRAGSYDLVLGADIVYLEDTFEPLQRTIEHLCSDITEVLLACKIRYERDTTFLGLLKQRFRVEEVYYDSQRDIHIYKAVKLSVRRDL